MCVERKDGRDGIRLAVDYRYVNHFTRGHTFPLPDIASVLHCIRRCRFISITDCKAGYWTIPLRQEDKWLTAFVCDAELFEFNRALFGLKCSGNTFVRAINEILRPVPDYAELPFDLLMTWQCILINGKSI